MCVHVCICMCVHTHMHVSVPCSLFLGQDVTSGPQLLSPGASVPRPEGGEMLLCPTTSGLGCQEESAHQSAFCQFLQHSQTTNQVAIAAGTHWGH